MSSLWIRRLRGIPRTANIKAIFVDSDSGRIDQDNPPALDDNFQFPQPKPDDPAYIFFTSGTTNVPKAVQGNHKGLSHFLNWQRETFKIQAWR